MESESNLSLWILSDLSKYPVAHWQSGHQHVFWTLLETNSLICSINWYKTCLVLWAFNLYKISNNLIFIDIQDVPEDEGHVPSPIKMCPDPLAKYKRPEVDLSSDIEGIRLGLVWDDSLVVVLRQMKDLQQGTQTLKLLISVKKWDNHLPQATFPRAD